MRILLLLGVVTWCVIGINAKSFERNGPGVKAVTEKINTFNKKFFTVVAEDVPGNLVCSPLSASMLLAMTSYGARGTTEVQFQTVLRLHKNNFTNSGLQSFIDKLHNSSQVEFHIANNIFYDNNLEPKDEFIKTTKDIFRSEAQPIDFENADEASKNISDWCEAHTNNHIKDLIIPDALENNTDLVLVSAVYFKGSWKQAFDVTGTQNRPFYVSSSMVKSVPTMNILGSYRFSWVQLIKTKWIEIPYKSDNPSEAMSMIIFLPDEKDGLAKLEKNLHKIDLGSLLKTSPSNVNLYLPKFKIESTIKLQKPLSKLGLGKMFSNEANFTGIVATPALKVTQFVQKAFIEVSEMGTEAAAATEMRAVTLSAPKEMVVDHPFLYQIILRSSRTVVFEGRVTDFPS